MEDYNKIIDFGTEEEQAAVKEKILIGEFQNIKKSGFFEEYEKLVNKLIAQDDAKWEASK